MEQLNDHDSTLFKKCLKWGPVWTCEGTGEETYRMLQGAEFIKNTAEGPHITSKHRHITIDGYSLTPDSRCVEAQSHLCFEYLTTSCLFNCAYSLENYRTLRLVIWHYSLPLIIVRFVVPDFWSHVIRRPHVCMSIGLWAAMQTQTNLLPLHRKYSHTPYKKWNCLCVTVPVQNTCRAKVPELDCGVLCQENILFQDTEERRNVLGYHINKTRNLFMYNIMHYHLIRYQVIMHNVILVPISNLVIVHFTP